MREFWGGRNGTKQMYELRKLVTLSKLGILNYFYKSNYVSTVNILPAKTEGRTEHKNQNFFAKLIPCKKTSAIDYKIWYP